ncbi:hypothetical protein PINS_up004099 [Pythium insidiosum]|nr:hypothetical protein PINS_up004099 [Pythium insidiosum]
MWQRCRQLSRVRATRALATHTQTPRAVVATQQRHQHHQHQQQKKRVAASAAAPFSSPSRRSAHSKTDAQHDRDASHLVCSKCNSPLSKTRDLVFFKWRTGIHLSCVTEETLQQLRAEPHVDHEDHAWKKQKLHCLRCDNAVGTLARVYTTDQILFKARSVAVQMPEHLSPMISLSGYPSSLLTFSMWSEFLLMLESQPDLKQKLQIRRLDNVREFSVEKKELNTQLLLAGDLRSLLRIVDERLSEMNHVNLMTALHRVSILNAQQHKSRQATPLPRFRVASEAPEDELVELTSHIINPRADAAAAAVNKERLWKLVDAVDQLVNFSGSSLNSVVTLTTLASALWRLKIGRPSILGPLAVYARRQMTHPDGRPVKPYEASLLATAIAHLSPKESRQEPWLRDVLNAAADIVLQDQTAINDPTTFDDVCGQLLQSFTFTDHFHEELSRQAFERLNRGILDEEDHRAVERSRGRAYLVHLDNLLAHRGEEYLLRPGPILDGCRAAFDARQKRAKHASFRMRHLVVKTLEGMQVDPESLYTFEDLGYIVDVALARQRIAIEIHNEDSYLAVDERDRRAAHSLRRGEDGDANDDDDVDIQAVERMRVMPFIDAKTRHLERQGWIVVQLPSQEFQKLRTDDDRREYLSVLIEIATYSRAAAIEAAKEEEELRELEEK